MKFTLSWLKDHLDTTASVEQLSTKLSAIGLEVEGVEDPAATYHLHRRSFLAVFRELSRLTYAVYQTRAIPIALIEDL